MDNVQDYNLKLSSACKKDIKNLPIGIRKEILEKHFFKLKSNPRKYSERLHGLLKGYYSYHFGHHPEYRIMFIIISNNLIIAMISTRANFYKEAYRRI